MEEILWIRPSGAKAGKKPLQRESGLWSDETRYLFMSCRGDEPMCGSHGECGGGADGETTGGLLTI